VLTLPVREADRKTAKRSENARENAILKERGKPLKKQTAGASHRGWGCSGGREPYDGCALNAAHKKEKRDAPQLKGGRSGGESANEEQGDKRPGKKETSRNSLNCWGGWVFCLKSSARGNKAGGTGGGKVG